MASPKPSEVEMSAQDQSEIAAHEEEQEEAPLLLSVPNSAPPSPTDNNLQVAGPLDEEEDEDDEAPLLVSVPTSTSTSTPTTSPPIPFTPNYTIEHELFVTYLKRFIAQEEIAFRLFVTFPSLVTREVGGNAHAKLADIESWVAFRMSRWAPVQEANAEQAGAYAWGAALVQEFGSR